MRRSVNKQRIRRKLHKGGPGQFFIYFVGKINRSGQNILNPQRFAEQPAGNQAAFGNHQQAIKLSPELGNKMVNQFVNIIPAQNLARGFSWRQFFRRQHGSARLIPKKVESKRYCTLIFR
jgi:hypothetical protein